SCQVMQADAWPTRTLSGQAVWRMSEHRVSAHTPFTQRGLVKPLAAQSLPQAPQLAVSWANSTQVLPHRVKPGRQVHLPPPHTWRVAPSMLQPPQFHGSMFTSAQNSGRPFTAGHALPLMSQLHWPALHTEPYEQLVP